jgi:hypothetical protein
MFANELEHIPKAVLGLVPTATLLYQDWDHLIMKAVGVSVSAAAPWPFFVIFLHKRSPTFFIVKLKVLNSRSRPAIDLGTRKPWT